MHSCAAFLRNLGVDTLSDTNLLCHVTNLNLQVDNCFITYIVFLKITENV